MTATDTLLRCSLDGSEDDNTVDEALGAMEAGIRRGGGELGSGVASDVSVPPSKMACSRSSGLQEMLMKFPELITGAPSLAKVKGVFADCWTVWLVLCVVFRTRFCPVVKNKQKTCDGEEDRQRDRDRPTQKETETETYRQKKKKYETD